MNSILPNRRRLANLAVSPRSCSSLNNYVSARRRTNESSGQTYRLNGGSYRIRTYDQLVKSQLLYQLS